jgi:hypothetical protein
MDLGTLPTLIQDMGGEFLTDMSIPDIISLAASTIGLKASSIHQYYMTNANGYATDITVPTRAGAALQPNWDKINALFTCVMSDKAYLGCKA